MNDADFNIYRIDDIFIRIGYGCLVLFVLIVGTVVSKMVQGEPLVNPGSMYGGAVMFGVPALLFLIIGYAVRRREKTAGAVWRKLEVSPEVAVRDLMTATGLSRGLLEKAVLTINRSGRGFYVWDRETDLIADARLRLGMLVVESCDHCGATIGKKYPISLDRAPLCPYCGNPLNMDRWNELKRKVIEEMKSSDQRLWAQPGTAPLVPAVHSFSKPVFFILLLLFWPAALIYALVRYTGR